MLLRSIFLLFFLLLASAANATGILVWGDSLSAGYGIKASESWPALLQSRLEKLGLDATVVNASISGETSAGGRSRLPAALARHKPAVVVIALGANDGLRGLPLKMMGDNLTAMIDASREAGAKVVLVGMRLPPNYGPAYTTKFQNTFDEVAAASKVPLVPFLLEGIATEPALFQADGIHPVAEAQFNLLDNVWPALKPLLRK
ncbi:MAG: arylesterase [Rhodocyclaceae bacterium]|nr:arylesterase [Rhodocyclaceae bacterium]MCP5233320.1 arylesterase [Zoogloeaceae bacterium]MCB1912264.1 arylesterase [Rhodocyclaceae bacterium]MCP5238880.1 arylesterase [Zoogloeaceae bacterium]MCP5254232.1 arylesterase [Zoogloeaceae bacterium]